MSLRASVRLRCTFMPLWVCTVGAITSNGISQYLLKPHRVAAEPWLRTARLPHARTAAVARPSGVMLTWPTP